MIFIGIGSNLPSSFGNKFKNIDLAISFLQEKGVKLLKKSSFYETFSQPIKNNPKFLNVVLKVEADMSLIELFKIVKGLDKSLNETLLSNAKLLYCNKTLSDASLNERQKDKIVEAIAKAKTPDEAKTLQETLKATVGSGKKTGPKSLSESVQRRSNLSSVMPRRKKPEQQYSFADHMKKLAGIK